jgi:hypothetical protein
VGADYAVPKKTDSSVFSLPATLITKGWLHVLEDSELALLMMVACGRGSEPFGAGVVTVPGDTRLLHYGIARDPFTSAHRTLEQFGLLEVEKVGRWGDGRAMESNKVLHRLKLLPAGLNDGALPAVRQALKLP